jgi:hypothetical protein
MYSLLLANPVKVTRSAFVINLALSLPVASIDSLTLDTLLPPAKIKDMNKTCRYSDESKLTDPFYSFVRLG